MTRLPVNDDESGRSSLTEATGSQKEKITNNSFFQLLHKWGFSPKVPRMRFVNATSKQEKDEFRKRQER